MCKDDARARPQREQRLLPAHRGLHRVQQQGQDHQDVGGADRLLRADIHGSQVTTSQHNVDLFLHIQFNLWLWCDQCSVWGHVSCVGPGPDHVTVMYGVGPQLTRVTRAQAGIQTGRRDINQKIMYGNISPYLPRSRHTRPRADTNC